MLRERGRALTRAVMMALALALVAPALGCGANTPRQPTVDESNELQGALRNFHKNLRWARYEFAAELIVDEYKQTFLGRYEELGDDFHIVMLEVTKVELLPGEELGQARASVEVEQQWYKEPNMTVKKDVFIELWERDRSGWRLTERLPRDEYRAREKRRKQEQLAAPAGDA